MASGLLSDRLAQIIHDYEMILGGEIVARGGAEDVEPAVGGMTNLDSHGMQREKPAELIERHALPGEDGLRQHRLGTLIEQIVLGEHVIRLIFRRRRRRRARRIEHHDDAGNAAIGLRLLRDEIVGDRKIRRERAAFEKVLFTVGGIEIGQIARQRQRFGARG